MKKFFLDLLNPNSAKSSSRFIALMAFAFSTIVMLITSYKGTLTENMYLYYILGWGGAYVLRQFAPQGQVLEATPVDKQGVKEDA